MAPNLTSHVRTIAEVTEAEDNLLSIESIPEPVGYNFIKAKSGREPMKILLPEFDFAVI